MQIDPQMKTEKDTLPWSVNTRQYNHMEKFDDVEDQYDDGDNDDDYDDDDDDDDLPVFDHRLLDSTN